MNAFARSLLHRTPGFRKLNGWLERHYTGCPHPEFVRRGSFLSPLPDLKEVAARGETLFDRDVVPRLKPGVMVHIHDIMWPFEYSREWIMEGRAWNEASLVRAFLQFNHVFQILFLQ